MNDKPEGLIKRKIVGLFHDPPWKPWVISGEIKIDSFKCKGEEIKVINFGDHKHENQGLTVAMKTLSANEDEIKKLMNYVRNSDVLSAALDRYLKLEEKATQKEKVNILNPDKDLTYPLEVKPKDIDGFVCEIIETSEKLKNAGANSTLLYNYLYGNIELIWYKYNDKALPLADTRVKTYSVFDHLYSTTSLLNWFDGKAFEGHLVKVDIPAVQDIISRSRKIYDLWGGSWLVSALLFYTILPFIEKYGADVVLSPFMGLNPFFHSYLRSKLNELNLDPNKYDYMSDFDASQPVMPATAYLALPEDEKNVEKSIRENYLNAWRKIVDAVAEKVDEKVKKELEKIKDYPIVPIRVSVKNVHIDINKSDADLVIEFDKLFREEFEDPKVKFSYGIPVYPLAKELSEGLYKEKKLYKQCTNCGVLPAFILKESETKLYNGEKVEDDKDLEEGEALCHYCYLRRKLHNATFKELEVEREIIPSTIDLANLDKWKEIMRKCVESEKGKMKAKLLIKLPKPLEEFDKCESCKTVWYIYATVERFFVKKVEDRKYQVEGEFKDCFSSIEDVNLYYAIVKGDGDFIGKRVWKGIVKMPLEDYIKATRVNVDEKLLSEFANKFREYLRNVYRCNENPDSEACKNVEKTIPITPDYLIAVSRSLMLVALKDIEAVQNYGVIVYAGGDDITFLSPLKMPNEEGKQITVIDLVELTRRNYWGAIPGEGIKPYGFMYFKNGIFDLPALYGRSYSVFVTHYKDPFYAMWKIASELEEKKDEAEAGEERQKDLTFVLGGRGMLNLEDAAILENRIETFEALEALYENIGKGLSKSFVKDYLSAYEEIKDLKDNLKEYLDKLLDYIIERNKKGGNVEKIREKLKVLRSERKINEEWRKVYDPRVEVVKAYDYLER